MASETRRLVAHLLAALPLAAVLLLGGCSSTKMKVEVTSTSDTNGGRPFYAVFRSVDPGTYVTDSYEAIAGKVFAPDPTVLRTEVVYPGVKGEIAVPKSEALPVGIYFLFTTPGEKWKILRQQPLPSSIQVELGKNDVSSTSD